MFTKEQLEEIVRTNSTWPSIMKVLNYTSCDYVAKVKDKLQKLGIDYSHVDEMFKKRAGKRLLLSEILVENSIYASMANLKRRLQNELGWEHICFKCKNTMWNNQPIPIQIDHINGVHDDNRIENLRFLCPNCHAQTDTYAGKNTRICKENRKLRETESITEITTPIIKDDFSSNVASHKRVVKPKQPSPPKHVCIDCTKALTKKATRCLDCYAKHKVTTRMVERPSLEQLEQDITEMSVVKVGEKYGVSDNCIRKWIKHYKKTAQSS
jgi:glutaredoxin-related protein